MFNKDKLTGYAAGLITAILLCSSAAFAQSIEKTITAVYNNIKIIVNGEEITPTDANGNVVEPFIADGTTYLPVRALANALGQEVFWDGETNSVYIGEMPEKEEAPETEAAEAYSVNNEILNKFSDLTLMNVGKSSVKGSFFNLYIATAVNDVYFPYQCDNYSPDATLQTMTIGSQKAAKVLTEDITDTYHTLYTVYNAAQKEGFTNDEAVKSAQNNQWEQFKAQFENDSKLNEFLKAHSISENDLKEYMSVYTVYNLYSEKLIGEYLSKTYSESELLKVVDKEYAKVKHILVEDEVTAKEFFAGYTMELEAEYEAEKDNCKSHSWVSSGSKAECSLVFKDEPDTRYSVLIVQKDDTFLYVQVDGDKDEVKKFFKKFKKALR